MTYRRRNRRAPRPATKSMVNRVSNRLTGSSRRVKNDPPPITTIPWNTIVLDTTFTFGADVNTKVVTGKILYDILVAQLGLGVDLSAQTVFRIYSIACWEVKGNSITLDVFDLINKSSLIAQVEDDPGRNHWAACMYKYADSQSQVTVRGDNTTDAVCYVSSVDSGTIKFRARVLWKYRYLNLPTRVIYVNRDENLKDEVDDKVLSISSSVKELDLNSWEHS